MVFSIVTKDNFKIYDISPTISQEIAVFPGDTGFESEFLLDLEKGDNLTLSTIRTTVHLGAHTDAPSHYQKDGLSMEAVELNSYLGPAQVIEVKRCRGRRIKLSDIQAIPILAPRVLFKTLSFPDPNHWNGDFASLSPEVIEYLAQNKVQLVGIDTPSVDPADDKELLTHQQIAKQRMCILEGIVLAAVPVGVYQLIALPLKIKGADASPVRAILMEAYASHK